MLSTSPSKQRATREATNTTWEAAWQAAPTAHQRITQDACAALALREAEKKLLTIAPTAPSSGKRSIRNGSAGCRSRVPPELSIEHAESDARMQLIVREAWEREVCCQFASMELVNYIIKPQVDRLQHEERLSRADIRMEEAEAFDRALNGRTHSDDEAEMKNPMFTRLRTDASPLEAFSEAKRVEYKKNQRFRQHQQLQAEQPRVSSAPSLNHQGQKCAEEGSDTEAQAIIARYCQMADERPASAIAQRLRSANAASISTTITTSGGRQSQAHLPAPPAQRSRYLDLATSVHLQNQYVYFRRGIENAEVESRQDLSQQFAEEIVRVDELTRRRQHLERLMYWRNERDAKRYVEERLAVIRGLLDDAVLEETNSRGALVLQEDECATDLWSAEYASYCKAQRETLEVEEARHRMSTIAEDNSVIAATLVPFLETLRRASLIAAYEQSVNDTLSVTHGNITQLQHFSVKIRTQCIVIQRAYRKIRLGLLGWRRTHRQLGESIKQSRAANAQRNVKASLSTYKKAMEDEMAQALQEIHEERRRQRQVVSQEERRQRMEITTDDEWFRAGFKRRFQTEWIHNIILPKFRLLEEEEKTTRQRMEIFYEASERAEWIDWHVGQLTFIRARATVRDTEVLDHFHLEGEEVDAREEIWKAMVTSREKVKERQRNHEMKQATDRATVEGEMYRVFRKDIEDAFRFELQDLFFEFKKNAVCVVGLSPVLSGRAKTLVDCNHQFVLYCEQFLEWSHAFFGRQLIAQSKDDSITIMCWHYDHQAHIERSEMFAAEIKHRQETVYADFTSHQQIIEEAVERRHRASRCIQLFYRRYLLGNVGRTGMRTYLRLMFEEKRARADIRRRMAEQRDDVAKARQELEDEIKKHNLATDEHYQQLLQYIEEKVEPRQRNAIASQEQFVVNIVRRNFQLISVDILKDNLAELIQHEAYFRTDIEIQWRRDHSAKILPRQQVFVKDVRIRAAQRAWRSFRARRERRARADELVFRLPDIEARERAQLIQRELFEFALFIEKPLTVLRTFHVDYFSSLLLARGMDTLAFGFPFGETIVEAEWASRQHMLWSMQQTVRYRHIEDCEGRERRQLTTTTLDAGRACADLIEEERTQREALEQERFLYLLRLVSLMEQRQRSQLQVQLTGSYRDALADLVEPFTRMRVEHDFYRGLTWPLIHYETNQRLKLLRAEENTRALLVLEDEEDMQRADKQDAQQSIKNWFTWLVGVQELRQRAILERERAIESQTTSLLHTEVRGRYDIWNQWQTKMSHPSFFSPKGVVSFSPPYTYCCEMQEEDMRRRTLLVEDIHNFWANLRRERDMVFAHYVNAGLHSSNTSSSSASPLLPMVSGTLRRDGN